MTRKLYLVNMSNHENEEYDISTNGQDIVNLIPGDKIEVEDASNGAERIVLRFIDSTIQMRLEDTILRPCLREWKMIKKNQQLKSFLSAKAPIALG